MQETKQYDVKSFDQWLEQENRNFPSDPEFSSLAVSVFKHLSAVRPRIKTVITEQSYVDFDYSAAYSHFYSYFFNPPPKQCIRHLFFCWGIHKYRGSP